MSGAVVILIAAILACMGDTLPGDLPYGLLYLFAGMIAGGQLYTMLLIRNPAPAPWATGLIPLLLAWRVLHRLRDDSSRLAEDMKA